jgi:hypothetical protein
MTDRSITREDIKDALGKFKGFMTAVVGEIGSRVSSIASHGGEHTSAPKRDTPFISELASSIWLWILIVLGCVLVACAGFAIIALLVHLRDVRELNASGGITSANRKTASFYRSCIAYFKNANYSGFFRRLCACGRRHKKVHIS